VREGQFERHLSDPVGRAPAPAGGSVGAAGGGACDDLVRIALRADEGFVREATFDAEGCGATIAAGSACVALVAGASLLDAAAIGSVDVARELGGLSPGKLHAAELAADALHRALSQLCSEGRAIVPSRPGRVVVAMSGGVDSAVAALEAEAGGHEVVAVTLQLWADPATDGTQSCCSPQAVVAARALAHSMGLPHFTLDLRQRFGEAVVREFLHEHDRGRTPNPCIRCNGLVRFDAMVSFADRIGAEALLTGHYARIGHDADGPLVRRAADEHKDQSYMLAALPPALLSRLRFPLGDLAKPEVREIARAAALPVAEKKESQDLCFMAGTTRARFLSRHARVRDTAGEIVDARGRVVGRHRGHRHFTVGQRRGLGVASSAPLYVLEKDAARNRIVVGSRDELECREVRLAPAHLYREGARVDRIKLRYRSAPLPCEAGEGAPAGACEELTIRLGVPAYGVAPGQTACLMQGDLVLGFGTIAAAN
jgi:tRNA-uridine 2-sulfurtransferase